MLVSSQALVWIVLVPGVHGCIRAESPPCVHGLPHGVDLRKEEQGGLGAWFPLACAQWSACTAGARGYVCTEPLCMEPAGSANVQYIYVCVYYNYIIHLH